MRYPRLLFLISSVLVFFNSSCEKETITNTITDTVLVRAVDTTFHINANSWNCYSYQTLDLIDSGVTKYSTTAEGIKFVGQAYRLGTRIQTKSEFGIYNKVLYYKWKVYGAGQFAAIVPQIKYDPTTNDGIPAIQGVDLALFSGNSTYGGSVLVQENTWYYTRVVPIPGTDSYQVITCSGNYNNLGGTPVSSTTIPVYTKSGYIALRLGDCYGSTNAFAVLGECKIAPN